MMSAENFCSKICLAFVVMAVLRLVSLARVKIAFEKALASSLVVTRPFTWCSMISGFPPALVTTQGLPMDMASSSVIEVPSLNEERRYISIKAR